MMTARINQSTQEMKSEIVNSLKNENKQRDERMNTLDGKLDMMNNKMGGMEININTTVIGLKDEMKSGQQRMESMMQTIQDMMEQAGGGSSGGGNTDNKGSPPRKQKKAGKGGGDGQ